MRGIHWFMNELLKACYSGRGWGQSPRYLAAARASLATKDQAGRDVCGEHEREKHKSCRPSLPVPVFVRCDGVFVNCVRQ
jgi:hypothetical protein